MNEIHASLAREEISCIQCGSILPAGVPPNSCPLCLLQLGLLDLRGESDEELDIPEGLLSPDPDREPSIAEMQPHFPALRVLGVIGRGGMGTVYLAQHRDLKRLLAIKMMRSGIPELEPRFLREAQVMADLSHPGIVGLHDFGRTDQWSYLVMEYVRGSSLCEHSEVLRSQPEDAIRLAVSIAEALQYAHGKGLVHRDIKPANILIRDDGHAKLTDFGLVKVEEEPDTTQLTMSGQIMGTPHYMAPEQFKAGALVDKRADVYSLGVVLYELLTGSRPVGGFAPPSTHLGSWDFLDLTVLRALSQRPDDRYSSAGEFAEDLRQALTKGPGCSRRRRGIKRTAFLVGIAVAVLVIAIEWPSSPAEASPEPLPEDVVATPPPKDPDVLNQMLLAACKNDRSSFKDLADLIRAGADINCINDSGVTPLMWACWAGKPTDALNMLIDAGANVNARSNMGYTPLMQAAAGSVPAAVAVLLQAGADPDAREAGENRRALEFAERNEAMEGTGAVEVIRNATNHE